MKLIVIFEFEKNKIVKKKIIWYWCLCFTRMLNYNHRKKYNLQIYNKNETQDIVQMNQKEAYKLHSVM